MTLLAVLLLAALALADARGVDQRVTTNLRPIIGVLQQSCEWEQSLSDLGNSYIPASVVQWLESAGARVVPIPYPASHELLTALFNSINGLLLPGGDTPINSSFTNHTAFLLRLAIEANHAGDHFPVFGICQGFQQLAVIAAGSPDVLMPTDGQDLMLPLEFTPLAQDSRMFKSCPAAFETFGEDPITVNLHDWGVYPAVFAASKSLSSFFDVLSTNDDRQGRTFISAMEGKNYPFYGTQFHPERNQFEWRVEEGDAIHTSAAVEAVQCLARMFVGEAQQSSHQFDTPEAEAAALIYASPVFYTAAANPYYQQSYVMP